jgi:hypothetical protein
MQLGALVDSKFLEAGPDRGVFYFGCISGQFGFAVGNTKPVIKKGMMEFLDCDVGEAIHRRRQNRTTVVLHVLDKVGAASKKAYPDWSLCDNHVKFIPIETGRSF